MVDINEVAGLLHVEEKLRAHGDKFKNMLTAVRAKLSEHEATHAPKPVEPEPEQVEEAPAEDASLDQPPAENIERRV